MKLPYTRYVKQIITDKVPNTQWLALQAMAFEQLKAAPWVRTDVEDSEFPLNDPLNFELSSKFDAFKASQTESDSGRQSCAMGIAAYVFNVPQDALTNNKFWTSLSVLIAADKFCVSGLRIATLFTGSPFVFETESAVWDSLVQGWPSNTPPNGDTWASPVETDAKGAFGLLSARENLVAGSTNKSATYTLSKPTYLWPTAKIVVIVGLQDYLAVRTDATGKHTREYWFEGSGILAGITADFTFTADVTPDASAVDPFMAKKVYSSAELFNPGVLRVEEYAISNANTSPGPTIEKVFPVDMYHFSLPAALAVPLEFEETAEYTGIMQDPVPLVSDEGISAAFDAIIARSVGSMRSAGALYSGCAQMAVKVASVEEAEGNLEKYRTYERGLMSFYSVVLNNVPRIISSLLYFPVYLDSPSKKLVLINGASPVSTRGSSVRLTAWFMPQTSNNAHNAGASVQRMTRALASQRDFWLGTSKTVTGSASGTSQNDTQYGYPTTAATATLLGSIMLPTLIAASQEFVIPCALPENTIGWIVIAPMITRLTRDIDGEFSEESAIVVGATGLGYELVVDNLDELFSSVDAEFPTFHDYYIPTYSPPPVEHAQAINSPDVIRGWRPDIFIY